MILAIETATNICSVSFQDNQGEIHEKRTEQKGSHSELLFLYVRELMDEHAFNISGLDAVLVSTGPGSYTGLRIAASAVKGLLFGLDVDIYAGNTLAGFAYGVLSIGKEGHAVEKNGTIHAVINARRKHLYHQQFNVNTALNKITEAQILELTEIEKKIKPGDFIIGTGIGRLKEKVLDGVHILDSTLISSQSLIHLFKSSSGNQFFTKTNAEELESNYLNTAQVNDSKV